MELPVRRVPIEADPHLLRARRTAAITRIAMGLAGTLLIVIEPGLLAHRELGIVGCLTIAVTAVVQLLAPRLSWLSIEESMSGLAGLLIIGFGPQRVGVLTILWLVAVASGVLARGGRVHWLGRNIVLVSLALPIVRYAKLDAEYAAFCLATLSLLLTSGRLTRELNRLLRQARLQADSAETLLLAGDIASRMSQRDEPRLNTDAEALARSHDGVGTGRAQERAALAALIAGEGLTMAVQPIVDLRSGAIHGYEALARFDRTLGDGGPLQWLSLAAELGCREELERACLRGALELFAARPPGTVLSVNLSAPVLLDPLTISMLHGAGAGRQEGLEGLVIEITEETLVRGEQQLSEAIAPLRERGALLAVDDMGAGYSGLRQITSVLPGYLKLDRSLITGIEEDGERAALVGALVGYAAQVGCLLVAEGVETEDELRAVRRLGVPLVQGFYLARPSAPWPQIDLAAKPAVSRAPARPTARAEVGGAVDVLQPV